MNNLLLLVTLIVSITSFNAISANGNVKFTGEIIQSTCKVVDNDKNKEVFLGKYPTTAFPTIGATSGDKAFEIRLEKCEAGSYTLHFDGNTLVGHPELLAVTGGAIGIGIEILNNKGQTLLISQEVTNPTEIVVVGGSESLGTATFNLHARYKSYKNQITAGEANSNATFTISYK
ncbi:major type 1 subunit fimbrin (pilin) [Serratia symbiotica str. 'Cinara cedri']|nr:major type 1 subunit fimbrin (pilin) [Serratia symbiotica str. 'Cinara cedri']